MNKKLHDYRSIGLLIVLLVILSGCSLKDGVVNIAQEEILKQSNIENNDNDYSNYIKYKNNNQIDSEGHYIPEEEDAKAGSVSISFFSNNHLSTAYYYDENRTDAVDQSNCFLNPGDSLYADYPKVVNQANSKYEFSSFVVYSYIEDNQKEQFTSSTTDGKILTIPESFNGDHLSIMAIGEYKDRTLSFSAYSYEQGTRKELKGEWIINGERYNGTSATLNSSIPYRVSYDYSSYINDYYFYNSIPKCFKSVDSTGIVEFSAEETNSNIEKFEVELKKYKKLSFINETLGLLSSNHVQSVKINGYTDDFDISKKENINNKIKVDDEIVVNLDKGYKVSTRNLEIVNEVELTNSIEFTIVVPNNDEYELSIVCLKNNATLGGYEQAIINNGTINVYHENGKAVELGEEVDNDEKVNVRITPNSGYYVSGKNVTNDIYSKTMKYKDYVSKINDIISDHKIVKYISVTLDTSDNYGEVTYTYNKNKVSGTIKLKENEIIKVKYVLNNTNYKFEDLSFFESAANLITNSNEKTFEIEVTEKMNGKTIKASDYIKI